jgi:CheY-like chemotaxis protein
VIKSFEDSGLTCDRARSTAEALNLLDADPPYDLIITDMGRVEDGTPDPQAGVRFIRAVKEAEITTPIVVYASRQALERAGDRAMEAGAARVTSSPTDLLLSLRLAPASELKSAVGNQLRDAGLTVRRVPLRGGIDFIAERNGEHWGVEVKKWQKPPDEKKLKKLREQAKLAKRQYSVDRVIAVVPGAEQLPDPNDSVPGVEFVPLDELGDYVNRT